jgi:hypothetical protein
MILAAVCAALTFKFPVFSGNKIVGTTGMLQHYVTATSSALLLVITVVVVAGCLVNIFNYKKRKQQLLINLGLIVLSLLNLFLYYLEAKTFQPGAGTYSFTALFPLLIPVLLILAARGIMRDEKLVKSSDRLR